jgi:hypothetical protein
MTCSANRTREIIELAIACGLIVQISPSISADDGGWRYADREPIVQRLAHQEGLIRSCECLLTYRSDPTDPKMIPLIEARCRQTGDPPAQYIYTKELAARHSHVGHWWRHGLKERFDQFPTLDDLAKPGATPTSVEAFDGSIARSYGAARDPAAEHAKFFGTIGPADHYLNMNRPYPLAFLDQYVYVPYSQLLARSRDAQVTKTAGRTTVEFAHPKFKEDRLKLTFGPDGSLLERDIIAMLPPRDRAPRVWERHYFSGYRTYRAASGESIRFPSQADYDYSMGTTDDGKLIVYRHVHIQVNSFQFNHQIPDEVFAIHFPEGCRIFDAATQVWLQEP